MARQRAMLVGTLAAVAAAPATLFIPPVALGLLVITFLTVLHAVRSRRKMDKAAQGRAGGAGRGRRQLVPRLPPPAGQRAAVVGAEPPAPPGRRRGAPRRGRRLARDWPARPRSTGRSSTARRSCAAARLHQDVASLGSLSATAPELDSDLATDLARALVARLTELRKLGSSGESFPLILDDPFVALDSNMKPPLLELLGRSSGNPQIIFLTEDEDVASWARLEALTGELAIVEPTPEHRESPSACSRRGGRRTRSRCRAATVPHLMEVRRADARRRRGDPGDLQPRGHDVDGDVRPRAPLLDEQRAWLHGRGGAHAAVVATDEAARSSASVAVAVPRPAGVQHDGRGLRVRPPRPAGPGVGKLLLGELVAVATPTASTR